MNRVREILKRGEEGMGLTYDDALHLLNNIDCAGEAFEKLLNTANLLNQKFLGGFGEVHGQIGLNWDTCSKNCQFCTFSEDLNNIHEARELSEGEVVEKALEFERLKAGSISIMSTADYDFNKFLHMGRIVAASLKANTPLFGNWGDLDLEQAQEVKKAGYTYYYHALRLGEGEVTGISRETRINTIKNAHRAGLLVGSCLEPIGPEHTCEEIMDILETLKNLNVSWMATMKRIPTNNSPLSVHGEISSEEFAKITAVTRLYFGKFLFTMAAHEPSELLMKAGANFLVAETGTNPRDGSIETSEGRGLDVKACHSMLKKMGYEVYSGNVNKRYYDLSRKNSVVFHQKQLEKIVKPQINIK